MDDNYLSVAQVSGYIKSVFESETLLQNISVYGEVSSYNISNGIAYFTIKDDNNLLNCVLFGALRFSTPKIGDLVLVTGSVSYYTKGGRLTFNASKILPYGKGLLYEKFLELKAMLASKGYFDETIKKSLPKRVKRIGVVTSATGAVIQDIIDVTKRRNNSVDIVLYPVKVQGVGAENEIANGINFFSNYNDIDCVIVARGGGSIEDLQPFNTEIVATATYKCAKPIVSAVGHETDYTIIDFVSDLRAPTPSAAAELVVNKKSDDIDYVLNYISKIEKQMDTITKKYHYKIDSLINNNENILKLIYEKNKNYVSKLMMKIFQLIDSQVVRYDYKLKAIYSKLNDTNPNTIINRGYTKIELSGKAISSVDELNISDDIEFIMKDGLVKSSVVEILKEV